MNPQQFPQSSGNKPIYIQGTRTTCQQPESPEVSHNLLCSLLPPPHVSQALGGKWADYF